MTVKVALVYPYFHPSKDNSIFRFPPLGLGYLAAALKAHGFEVELVDCTFMQFSQAVEQVVRARAQIVGFYSMFSMKKTTLGMAETIKARSGGDCGLLVVGGPMPSWSPESFLNPFDVVAVGEGEETMVELANCVSQGIALSNVRGIVFKENDRIVHTKPRPFIRNLDILAYPSRELFDNQAYQKYYLDRFGYSTSSMITSRGCPFSCDFCSRPIFGVDMRSRSVDSIVGEVEQIKALGYSRVWFADDCFTLNRTHLLNVCNELNRRGVDIGWECLSRVDTMDVEVAERMKRAGCLRVFFGIESGSNSVLGLMNKCITTAQAKRAVYSAKSAGLKVGAFFIVGYPGESNKTVLETVHFAAGLPLDYLSFTLPYPIPGTPLYERVKDKGVAIDDWEEPKNYRLIRHKLLYASGFSERKLKFAIGKAHVQFYGRKYLGKVGYSILGKPFERLSDGAFEIMW
ncbi:MAG: radical SAM protein [Candidatus Bathyarchaeia archaeon]|jgi:anaerobic magnesium-protoporphyrin IX monomethyl ester cyclase